MDRRTVLAATASLPAWLSLGFGQTPSTAAASTNVRAWIERARRVGKPLFVILVPAADPAVRGQMWGEYLAHLTDEQALDLALCEVVCAQAADVSAVLPEGDRTKLNDAVWAVVVETHRDVLAARTIAGDLGPAPAWNDSGAGLESRGSKLGQLIRAAVMPLPETVALRLKQCRASVPDEVVLGDKADTDAGRYQTVSEGTGPFRLRDLDRYAAMVRFGGPGAAGEKGDRVSKLADAARLRVFEDSPSGATWWVHSNHCPPCGMGHTPSRSRYFLTFYTQ